MAVINHWAVIHKASGAMLYDGLSPLARPHVALHTTHIPMA